VNKGFADLRASNKQQPTPRGKVLVVDEDLGDLIYYREILEGVGYEVVSCASYAEGINCLERELYDFIVVDQGSRMFEGRCVLERAIEIERNTAVLIVTGCFDMGCYVEALHLGAIDYREALLAPQEMARVVETHARPPGGRLHRRKGAYSP